MIGVVAAVVVAAAVAVTGFVWPGFFRGRGTDDGPGASTVTEVPYDGGTRPTPTRRPEPTPEPAETPYVNSFTDVSEADWFYGAVLWAGRNGIVSGETFRPGDVTNRAQALTFLWRQAGSPAPLGGANPFSDVAESDYFYAPALWGYENGLISAGSGKFNADNALDRAQAITFLFRAAHGSGAGLDRAFLDVREDSWYYDAANWAYEKGIVGRDESLSFRGEETVTRAQFVTFMDRAFDPEAVPAPKTAPEDRGFAYYGIRADVDSREAGTFRVSVADSGVTSTGRVSVAGYEIFDSRYGYPAREGYEWRVLTLKLEMDDWNYLEVGGFWSIYDTDYYNVRLYDDSREMETDADRHTVLWKGYVWDISIHKIIDDLDDGTYLYTVEAQVPKGYDGLVAGFFNASGVVWQAGQYFNDVYSAADFALCRLN